MAGEFRVGCKIQAVDELGRWCTARIVESDESGGYLVTFPGYPDCDRHVSDDEVRDVVPPFAEQQRRNCHLSSERRSGIIPTKKMLRFMNECQKGDQVTTAVNGHGIIQTVDPFNRTFDLEDGTTIGLLDIILPVEEEVVEQFKKKRRKSPVSTNNEVQISHAETGEESMDSHLSETETFTDWTAFRVGSHQCGKLYEVTGLGIKIIVKDINLQDETAVCWPVIDDSVDKETTITIKLTRLLESKSTVKGALKKVMTATCRAAFRKTTTNMLQDHYRRKFREAQLITALRYELSAAFRCRSRRKNFDLGLMNVAVDCQVFGLSPPDSWSMEYSYRKGNIARLDQLLGALWDIKLAEGGIRYVTSIRVRVTPQLMLSGSIRIADYDSDLDIDSDYRTILKDHMSASFP